MKAMILAAGVGSRLDPLTRAIPKPMVPVVNRPVIEHIVLDLKKHGFDEIMVNLHYLGDVIQQGLGDGSRLGVHISYAQEDKLWGDAGSVKRSQAFFGNETFLVVGGDDISDIDLSGLMALHREKQAASTIATTVVEDPSQFGIVVTDEDGRITRFLEKPKGGDVFSNTANTGVYVFEPDVFDLIPPDTFWGFGNNVFPSLLAADRPLYGFATTSYWKDVGNLQVYRQTNFDALAGLVDLDIPAAGGVRHLVGRKHQHGPHRPDRLPRRHRQQRHHRGRGQAIGKHRHRRRLRHRGERHPQRYDPVGQCSYQRGKPIWSAASSAQTPRSSPASPSSTPTSWTPRGG